MQGFEKAAIRIMGLIVLGCLLILYLQLLGCTTAPNGAINKTVVHEEPDGFKIWDRYLETYHVYNQPVIIHHQEGLSLYCKKHSNSSFG